VTEAVAIVEASLAAAVAFVLCGSLVLALRRPAKWLGLVDSPGGRKQHHGAVPVIGGVALFAGYVVGILINVRPEPALLLAALVVLAVGTVDDIRGMASRHKLVAQILAALIVVGWGGLVVPSLGTYPGLGAIELGLFAAPFTVIAVVGLINGVNMLDGLDGLAGGVSFAALAWLLAIAVIADQAMTLASLPPLLGAIAAFLVFNMRNPWRRKASVFLGDAGSMLLGLAMAWYAVALAGAQDRVSAPGIAWVVALPVIDTVSLMVRRVMKGYSPFAPDREHLHHIFERAGYTPKETSAFLTLLAAVMGLVGVGGSLIAVPDVLLVLGLLAVAAAHFVFIKAAWRTMRALRRVRGQPSPLLGCPPAPCDRVPLMPCWPRRLGLAGLYLALASAPFDPAGVVGGFAVVLFATLLVLPKFLADVRSLPVVWVVVALAGYLALRGLFPALEPATASGLDWLDLFWLSGLLSLPLGWWLACHPRHWRGLLAVVLVAAAVNLAIEVDWRAVNAGSLKAPFARGDTGTSGIINTSVLLFLVAGMVAALRRLGRGWRPACQFAGCLVLSVPLVFLLVTAEYATAWLGLLAGVIVLAFLAIWYGITRRQWVGLAASVALIAALGGGFYTALQGGGGRTAQLIDPLQAGMLVLEGRPEDAAATHQPTVNRLQRWANGLGIMAQRPWLGSGTPALPDTRGAGQVPGKLDNLYLAIGLGFGLVGLGLFTLLGLLLAHQCVCAVRDRVWSGETGMAVLGVAAAFAVMFLFVAPIEQLIPMGAVVLLLALMMAGGFERRWAAQAAQERITRLATVASASDGTSGRDASSCHRDSA